ncbi:MAG: glycosyltransferase family 4 protein [Candidatus Vogelbacteria bacterium]|nr:glycosyltransferase family 4 protein [Candidatus Vogelbacteria bacterium]
MKVLTIGSDRQLFVVGSEVRQRIIDLATASTELHIVVFAKRSLGLQSEQIVSNVWIYPTNSASRWHYVWDAVRLGRQFRGIGIEVVSGQDPFECGLAAWFVSRRLAAKLQLQIHTDFLNPYFWHESFLNKIRVLLARFLLPRADSVRVVSRMIADSLQSAGCRIKANPVILPVFVDVGKIKNSPIKTDLRKKYPQFDKIILMASRFTREKNIGLAIEAMHEIVKFRPKTGLVIVGDGSEEKKLKAKSYKLKANVIFEPWTDDLASYYKTADLFLVTSLYEGYGRTIIEALACGCQVVSTDVGVAREVGAIIATRTTLVDLIKQALFVPKKATLKNCLIQDKQLYLRAYSNLWTI